MSWSWTGRLKFSPPLWEGLKRVIRSGSKGTSLVTQWLWLSPSMQEVWVRSLVGELKPHMLHGMAKRNRSGHRGGRRASCIFLLIHWTQSIRFWLRKDVANYFQEGTQKGVWGDLVLVYCSHFSAPTLLLRPFEDIEMGGLAMVMDWMSSGKTFMILT